MLQDIVTATAGLEEVKQSGKFGKVLELILLMGNYMNAGSRNEQSVGFQFSYITKVCFRIKISLESIKIWFKMSWFLSLKIMLSDNYPNVSMICCIFFQLNDTKTIDNRQTLMHFLVNTLEKHNPELMDFYEELSHSEKAARGRSCYIETIAGNEFNNWYLMLNGKNW